MNYDTFIQWNIMGACENETRLPIRSEWRRQNVIRWKFPEWVSRMGPKMGNWLFGGYRTFDTFDDILIPHNVILLSLIERIAYNVKVKLLCPALQSPPRLLSAPQWAHSVLVHWSVHCPQCLSVPTSCLHSCCIPPSSLQPPLHPLIVRYQQGHLKILATSSMKTPGCPHPWGPFLWSSIINA